MRIASKIKYLLSIITAKLSISHKNLHSLLVNQKAKFTLILDYQMLRINHYNSLFCMRSIPKSHIKHCLISQSYILFTYFVFSWVVEASAVHFIDCLAHVPWQQRSLDAGSLLTSFFTASSLCINSSVTSVALTCITAYAQYFSIFHCFPIQCFFTAVCCIVIICKHTFSTFTLLNLKGF